MEWRRGLWVWGCGSWAEGRGMGWGRGQECGLGLWDVGGAFKPTQGLSLGAAWEEVLLNWGWSHDAWGWSLKTGAWLLPVAGEVCDGRGFPLGAWSSHASWVTTPSMVGFTTHGYWP